MKNKDYKAYAPDKHGPAANERRAESAAFIRELQAKHGISDEQLYPTTDRNRYKSYRQGES